MSPLQRAVIKKDVYTILEATGIERKLVASVHFRDVRRHRRAGGNSVDAIISMQTDVTNAADKVNRLNPKDVKLLSNLVLEFDAAAVTTTQTTTSTPTEPLLCADNAYCSVLDLEDCTADTHQFAVLNGKYRIGHVGECYGKRTTTSTSIHGTCDHARLILSDNRIVTDNLMVGSTIKWNRVRGNYENLDSDWNSGKITEIYSTTVGYTGANPVVPNANISPALVLGKKVVVIIVKAWWFEKPALACSDCGDPLFGAVMFATDGLDNIKTQKVSMHH